MISQEKLMTLVKPLKRFGPAFVLLMFAAVVWLLKYELRKFDLVQIRDAVLSIPAAQVAQAAGLTALYYLAGIVYDFLTVMYLQHRLRGLQIAMLSFVGRAVSLNFGSMFAGSIVRVRLYLGWGFSNVQSVQFIALAVPTFWSGFYILLGVVFLFDPVAIPASWNWTFHILWPIGVLTLMAGYYFATWRLRQAIRLEGWGLSLPTLNLALAQTGISFLAVLLNAAVIFVLLPRQLQVDYFTFLAMFLLTTVFIILSRVPAGWGVLELAMVLLLSPNSDDDPLRPEIIAALLSYRAIFHLVPLGISLAILIVNELLFQWDHFKMEE